jgi:uncharacterized protein YdaU (DUF1376 family)
MKEALPYYRWHWRDYRANRKVKRMDYVARGLYRELLDECWAEGFIPNDIAKLSEICGCPERVLAKAWKVIAIAFREIEPGILISERMNEERTEKDSHRIKCAISGRLGGISKVTGERTLANASERHIAVAIAEQSTSKAKAGIPFNSIEAAKFVTDSLQEYGRDSLLLMQQVIDGQLGKRGNLLSPSEIAESMVHAWEEYSRAQKSNKYAKGIKKFFGSNGFWRKPELWKGNDSESTSDIIAAGIRDADAKDAR